MHENEEAVFSVLALLICAAAVGVLSYWLGYRTACKAMECPAFLRPLQPFYAAVLEARDNTLTVRGMAVNETVTRAPFSIPVSSETKIIWNSRPIPLERLKPGDTVAIRFAGEELEIRRLR